MPGCPISPDAEPRIQVSAISTGTYEIESSVCMTPAEYQDLSARLASADPKVASAARCEVLSLALQAPAPNPLVNVRNPTGGQLTQVLSGEGAGKRG